MTRGAWLQRWSQPASGAQSRPAYLVRKILRHLYWARTEGLRRLVEEDRLDPRVRFRVARAKAAWRRSARRRPGSAVPVYVVGLQRSGTNMLLRGMDEAPEVEVRNENDRRVFDRFQLRSDDVLVQTIERSRHELVLVKPLTESHRVDQLLALGTSRPGKALWVYRDAEARARSEVSKFGSANLQALRAIAAGNGETIWQGRRLGKEAVTLVRTFDVEAMTPHAAAVLFWVVRNHLFFDLGLDRRKDVLLVSYDAFAAAPEAEMRRVCGFLGFPYRAEFCAHVDRRDSHPPVEADLDPRIRAATRALTARLDAHRLAQARPWHDGTATSGQRVAERSHGAVW